MRKKIEKKVLILREMHLFLFHMFSLLETGYLLSAGNVLRTSPKIWHVKRRDFP